MTLSDERLAKNEAHFRNMNERLNDLTTSQASTTEYFCECSAASCVETLELTREEYEHARSLPTLFVVVPGHQRADVERVVDENARFMLVEKVVAAEEISEADPRPD